MEDESIKQKLDKIIEKQQELDKTSKEKPFKLPFFSRLNKKQVKNNWVLVCRIKNNRDVDFVKEKIEDSTTYVDGVPRVASNDYMLSYKGKPMVIQPEWSLKPFSPVQNLEETEKEKMNVYGSRLIINRMEKEVIEGKKNMGGLIWVILGLAAAGLLWYLFKGGGKLF